MLVALNQLGGFGKACPFEMVIAVLHKAMQQDSAGCSTGPGQKSTAAADMCTAINTANVLSVHTTSGTGAWQWHSGDGGKTDIDSTHLERTAVHVAANGLKNKWTFNAFKVLQKICQLLCECAGHGVLMKFTLEIVYQQEAERLKIDREVIEDRVGHVHEADVDAEMTYTYAKVMIAILHEYLVENGTPMTNTSAIKIQKVRATDSEYYYDQDVQGCVCTQVGIFPAAHLDGRRVVLSNLHLR